MTLKSTANFLQKLTPPIATQHVNKQAGGTLKSFIQCQAQGVPLLLFSDSPTPTQRELTDFLCPTSHHPSTQAKTHQQPPSCSGTLHQDCVGALCTYTAAQHSQRFLCLRQKNAPSLRANKAGLWKAAAELLLVSVQGFGFLRQSCQPWKKKTDSYPCTMTPYCTTYRECTWGIGKLCVAASHSWCKGDPLRSAGCWTKLAWCGPARSR